MGMRCRAMFKMDFAEALYIAELRSGIAGHFSYRRVAWEMYTLRQGFSVCPANRNGLKFVCPSNASECSARFSQFTTR
jgi:hypothetical protein